ncbi:MAG: V-type ATP synthase subunit F [Clostridia bacterium]|jgi:V/A-type H+-transporting ATPase subunit F|nr:V-type ATP synthase subunit F [Clostridia bacterium]
MYKIGMIGERDSVIGFMALGFAVHEAEDVDGARALLHTLAKNSEYAIIYIVENYAIALAEDIAKYKDAPTPAIICIPGKSGTTGYGLAQVKKAVERAVGADILFKE